MTTQSQPQTKRRSAPWLTVARRELVVLLTNRAFIISTITMLALTFGSLGLSALMDGPKDTKIATLPAARTLVDAYGDSVHAADDKKRVTAVEVADRAAGEAALADGKAEALVLPTDSGYEVVVKKFESSTMDIKAGLAQVAQSVALAQNAAKAGTTPAQLMAGSDVAVTALDGGNDHDAAIIWIAGLVFSILFFMSALMFGMQIAQSVTTEKQSRIVEILAAAIPTRQLLAGKVAAYTLVSLGQVLLLLGAALVGVSRTPFSTLLPQLSTGAIWFVPFFLAGFLALACVWAAAGAMATRQEDLSQTTGPITMVLGVAYMAGFMATGTWRAVLSFVPVLSTILMPVRMMAGEATWVEALIALLITIVFGAIMIVAGARMYRRGLFATGKVLGFRQALTSK